MKKSHILDICIDCEDRLKADCCVLADLEATKKGNIEDIPDCVKDRLRVLL